MAVGTGLVENARRARAAAEWNWRPSVPIANSPLFSWPPAPRRSLAWLATTGFVLSYKTALVGLSVVTWLYLQPALERCVTFQLDWVAQMYLRNLALVALLAGGLHLYFYTFRRQGDRLKFDPRALDRKRRRFSFGDQLWDNIWWTCASGVTVWTAYEAAFMWAYANGYVPYLPWQENLLWFACLFVLIPVWESMHFYFIHRLLHWRPLFRMAHAVHHRNVNAGPWSGLSMHPLEHVLYLSSAAVHALIASHPVHVLFHLQYLTLGGVASHAGFERLLVRGERGIALGSFHHQLHHRYFECNYGNVDMPWDLWLKTFHDGTDQATRALREAQRRGGVKRSREDVTEA